jgi:hypothetical protein
MCFFKIYPIESSDHYDSSCDNNKNRVVLHTHRRLSFLPSFLQENHLGSSSVIETSFSDIGDLLAD